MIGLCGQHAVHRIVLGTLVGRDRTIEAENEGKGISCDAADGCEQAKKMAHESSNAVELKSSN